MGRGGLYWKDRKGEKWMEEGMEKGEVRVGKIPAFQNRSKVGPEKCILDNQFGPRFGPRTSDIPVQAVLDRYIYLVFLHK